MSQIQIAERYAKSLIDLAQDQHLLPNVFEDIRSIEALCANKEFASLLKSPVISSDKKIAVINGLLQGKISELTMLFIRLLIQKGREQILPAICHAFTGQYKKINKIQSAQIITAVELNESEMNKIKTRFASWLQPGETMELTQKVDSSLIGGFIFEMGDQNYDASVKRQLDEMKENLYDKSYISLVEKK